MPSLGNLTSTRLPTAESFRSRFTALHFAAYLHGAALSFGNMLNARLCVSPAAQLYFVPSSKRGSRTIRCSVSGSGSTPSSTNSTRSGTRLTRAIQAFQIKLIARIKELKRDFPVKILFFLVGFYCATAFATVIGQTGDWDILSAALAVTVVEAIGALMYGASLSELKKDFVAALGSLMATTRKGVGQIGNAKMRRSFFQSYRMRHLKSSIIEDYKYSVADPGEDSATDFSKYSGVPSLDLQYD